MLSCDSVLFDLSPAGEMIMEKTYWLGRKRASLKMASEATNSKARLIHFDLAGRYSVRANEADIECK
jgi:hypothetical protein